MYFSTYKRIAYAGVVLFPILMFLIIWGASGSTDLAIGIAVLMTVIMTPLQFFQLSRLQDRLDDHGGSIPLSWVFDWDLEDDEGDEPSDMNSSSPARTVRTCPSCGLSARFADEAFCSRCGAPLS